MASSSFKSHTIAGCSVNVMRGGKGPPLLFLHGAGGAGVWLPFMEKLSERYDVIVPDHPGFGRSDTPEWLDDIGDLAFFYLDFLEALDLDDVHLVGNSLGGWIAAEIAIRNTAAAAHADAGRRGRPARQRACRRATSSCGRRRSACAICSSISSFADQRLAHAADRGARSTSRSRTSSRPPTSPGTRASTIRACASGFTASTSRR